MFGFRRLPKLFFFFCFRIQHASSSFVACLFIHFFACHTHHLQQVLKCVCVHARVSVSEHVRVSPQCGFKAEAATLQRSDGHQPSKAERCVTDTRLKIHSSLRHHPSSPPSHLTPVASCTRDKSNYGIVFTNTRMFFFLIIFLPTHLFIPLPEKLFSWLLFFSSLKDIMWFFIFFSVSTSYL